MHISSTLQLELKELACGYDRSPVLSGVSLCLTAGEILCILGRNGIGKTTLFRTLLGSLLPLQGSVLLGGKDLFSLSRRERAARIAYVPQSHNPPFAFCSFDIVLMGRSGHGTAFSTPSARDKLFAQEAMERLGIAHLAKKAYTKISGGERQMVLIARALCQGSDFVLLDEPATSLDVANQARVLSVLRELAHDGKGVVFTSHDPNHALLLNARVAAVKSKDELVVGRAAEAISTQLAHELYGVRAALTEVYDSKGEAHVKAFVPFLE